MSKELEDKDVEDKRQKRKVSMDKLFLGDPDRIHLATTKILFGSCFLGNYLVAIVMDASDPVGIAMNPNDPADIVIYTIESCRFPTAVWRTERKLVKTQGLKLFALCN